MEWNGEDGVANKWLIVLFLGRQFTTLGKDYTLAAEGSVLRHESQTARACRGRVLLREMSN